MEREREREREKERERDWQTNNQAYRQRRWQTEKTGKHRQQVKGKKRETRKPESQPKKRVRQTSETGYARTHYSHFKLIGGHHFGPTPQWGAADAEIKVPSGENTELKGPPFKAWSRSAHSHTCYTYCQGFLPCLFLPFQSIHLYFFRNLSRIFPALVVANTGSCVGLQNKIGHLLDLGSRVKCQRNTQAQITWLVCDDL